MRYFLTGATGFIGRRLALELLRRGHEVAAVVRSPAGAADLAEQGADLHRGDVIDAGSLRAPMAGADGVFHVAGWYKIGVRDAATAHAVNVEGTRNVLTAMRELGIPRGVYTSTLAVNSDTGGVLVDESYRYDGSRGFLSAYDRSKWLAHHEVAEPMMAAGLPLVIVMPGVVYGPGDTSSMGEVWRQYLRRRLPVAPRKLALSWAHVDDIVGGHILAMEHGRPGETYIIAGPTHTFVEALAIAERITGIPAPRYQPSPGLMRAMAQAMEAVGRVVPLPASYTGEGLRVTAGVTYIGSNAKAASELGYRPRPLEEGLRETLEHELKMLRRGPEARTPEK